MPSKFLLAGFLLAGAFVNTLDAQQGKTSGASADPCDGAGSTVDVRVCEVNRVADSDRRLNLLYDQILSRLSQDEQQSLRALQRTWMEYRDGQCKAEGLQYKGGTLEPIVVEACIAKETEFRIKDLHAANDGP